VLRFLIIGWGISSLGWVLFAQILHAATFGSFQAAGIEVIHRLFRGKHQAKGQALFASLSFGAGGTLGGLYSGYTWDALGPQLTFSIAAACAAIAFFLVLWKLKPQIIEILKAFKDSLFALVMPLIIVGGILGGVFTPTEAGAVAAGYAFFAGIFIFKELKLSKLPAVLHSVTITTAKVMFIIGAASLLGWILTFEQVPKLVSQTIFSITHNKYLILLIINIFYLILGCLMETVAAIFLTAPILMPMVVSLGVDPVHFGLIMTVNLMIGTLTPPVAVVMYVVNGIAGITVEEFTKELIPFLAILIAVLLLITYFPPLVMFLPNLFFK